MPPLLQQILADAKNGWHFEKKKQKYDIISVFLIMMWNHYTIIGFLVILFCEFLLFS